MAAPYGKRLLARVVADFRRQVAEMASDSLHMPLTAGEINELAWGTLCVLIATEDWQSTLGRLLDRVRRGDTKTREVHPELRRLMDRLSATPSASSVASPSGQAVVEEPAHAG